MSLDPQRATRRYHHGDLRASLIDEALALLAESGLAEFSVARLARRVGVSPAAPYRHFADREELLAAVAMRSTAILADVLERAATDAGADPQLRLAAATGAYARFVLERGVGLELAFAAPFRSPRFASVRDQSRRLMDLLLALADAASPTSSHERSLELLEALIALAEGFAALQRRDVPSFADLSPAAVAERSTEASLILIRGIGAR